MDNMLDIEYGIRRGNNASPIMYKTNIFFSLWCAVKGALS